MKRQNRAFVGFKGSIFTENEDRTVHIKGRIELAKASKPIVSEIRATERKNRIGQKEQKRAAEISKLILINNDVN